MTAGRGPLIAANTGCEQPIVEAGRDFGIETADGSLSATDATLGEMAGREQKMLLGLALREARVAADFPIEALVAAAQCRIEAEAECGRGELVVGRRGRDAVRRNRDRGVGEAGVAQPRLHAIAELVRAFGMRQRQACGDAIR